MNQEEQRKINYATKYMHLPKHVDKQKFGKLVLNNIVTQQIEDEQGKEMDDVLQPTKQNPISESYDLGNWEK